MKTEIWKAVVGYEDRYKVSDQGRVFSILSDKIMSAPTNSVGYPIVTLYGAGIKRLSFSVHRLVLEAFEGDKSEDAPVTRHLNGIRHDNRLCNLKWGTYAENERDKRRHGTACIGEKNPNVILTEQDIKYIRENYIKSSREWGAPALSRRFGVSRSAVTAVVIGQNWSALDYVRGL